MFLFFFFFFPQISGRLTYPSLCQIKNLQNLPEKTLLENGISSCFPDDQICNLLNCDADKEGSVASPLQVHPLVFSLQSKGKKQLCYIRHSYLMQVTANLDSKISVTKV